MSCSRNIISKLLVFYWFASFYCFSVFLSVSTINMMFVGLGEVSQLHLAFCLNKVQFYCSPMILCDAVEGIFLS